MVLAPSHLARVGAEVLTADAVVNAHLGAAKASEIRLGLIGASLAVAVALRVVDALRQEAGVELVPPGGRSGSPPIPLPPFPRRQSVL